MKKMNYPKFAEHKRYHNEYIFKIGMYNADFNTISPKQVTMYIKEWLLNHILISDLEFENYKNEIQLDISY